MPTVDDVCRILQQTAPLELAEDWDNVGLLVGDRAGTVSRIMTCLTLTPASVAEAVDGQVDFVATHHPLPFRPLARITSDTTEGRMLLALIAARIAVYSPHTAFDSARAGINQKLAYGLELQNVEPLVPVGDSPAELPGEVAVGGGRCGILQPSLTVDQLTERLKAFLGLAHVRVVGRADGTVERVAVACGSGGSFLAAARDGGCDCLVTGETSFHTCLEAEAHGVALLLTGHFASERFGVEWLAEHLRAQLPDAEVWASRSEADPLRTL
jgi:dinuclear metal center YbgI/SA1388 family protein